MMDNSHLDLDKRSVEKSSKEQTNNYSVLVANC